MTELADLRSKISALEAHNKLLTDELRKVSPENPALVAALPEVVSQGRGLALNFSKPPPSPRDMDGIEELFRLIDADSSGEVDLAEFKLACLLSISDEALVEETFRKIDTDGSGEIGLDEFRNGFAFLQEQISYTRNIEEQLRKESAALEQAGEEVIARVADATILHLSHSDCVVVHAAGSIAGHQGEGGG